MGQRVSESSARVGNRLKVEFEDCMKFDLKQLLKMHNASGGVYHDG